VELRTRLITGASAVIRLRRAHPGRSVLRLFVRGKKSPLAGVLDVALTRIWKGGVHA
jgi:hypothetical protein